MRKMISVTCLVASLVLMPLPSFAQAPDAGASQTLRLTVDDVVRMALDRNIDLAAVRLEPEIGDTHVAAAAAAFRPTFTTGLRRNNQVDPPASFLVPIPTRTDAVTSDIGLTQRLPRFGTSYSLSWTTARTSSNSVLTSYDPLFQSGLQLSVSQPLLRDLTIDSARQQLTASRLDRDVADTRLREAQVRTTADVKRAYWNLVSAKANVDARQSALDLAEELVRVNTAKVNIGNAPPLDLLAAQAEVAADQEQLVIARTTVRQREDQLRALIFDTSTPSAWNVSIEPVDAPPSATATPDLDRAVSAALSDRADLVRGRTDIERARLDVRLTGNQQLPDVRLNASYLASGLGGTQLLRGGGFPGVIVGPGADTGFASVLNQLMTGKYSTWIVGLTVNHPLGPSAQDADHARATLEQRQAEQQLKSAQSHAIQEVRDAWRQIETNAERIESARAARELADERLDAERKRLDVGLSTSFLVIQAQRDLTQAKTNEVDANLAYALALVDFEAVQQASPTP